MTLTYDQLTLLEKVFYHDAVGDHFMPPEPVGYTEIEYIAHSGWIARSDGRMLHPWYYCPAPLNPEFKLPDNVQTLSSLRANVLSVHFELFGGQHQDNGDRPSFHVEPLMDERDSASNHVEISNEIAGSIENSLPDFSKSGIEEGDRPQSAHQKTDGNLFGGQDQDKISDKALQSVTESVFGEY